MFVGGRSGAHGLRTEQQNRQGQQDKFGRLSHQEFRPNA
jgi:hypothetical protein